MTDYTILSHRVTDLEKRVKRLNKKGGNIVLTVVSAERHEKYPGPNGEECWRSVADVTLEGLAPCIAGWSFLAALERLDNGENVVTSAPGVEVPEQYRNAEPNCDHCGTNRRRIYTFVLRSDSGEYKQVGKTCLQDFLRDTDPGFAVNIFGLLGQLEAWGNLDEDMGSGGAARGWGALTMIACTVRQIKNAGWVSRSKCADDQEPTADAVLRVLAEKGPGGWDTADEAKAQQVIAWVGGLTAKSDYEHNLCAILGDGPDGFVRNKHAGFACSAVVGYDNAMARLEREAQDAAAGADSKHFGEVGKRYKGLSVTVSRVSYFQGNFGVTTILGMVTDAGERLTWFASNGVRGVDDEDSLKGQTIRLDGTVKSHGEFKGIKDTKLTRCKIHLDSVAKG